MDSKIFLRFSILSTVAIIALWLGFVLYVDGVRGLPSAFAGFVAGWYAEKMVRRIKEVRTNGTFRCIDSERGGEPIRA